MTKDEARQFFVSKVLAEAERSAVPVSPSERAMLDWSEVEQGCVADPQVTEALSDEMSDEEYEAKMSGLLEAAYERDAIADSGAKAAYREAYSALSQGDYYLLVILDHSLARRIGR